MVHWSTRVIIILCIHSHTEFLNIYYNIPISGFHDGSALIKESLYSSGTKDLSKTSKREKIMYKRGFCKYNQYTPSENICKKTLQYVSSVPFYPQLEKKYYIDCLYETTGPKGCVTWAWLFGLGPTTAFLPD